MFSLSSSLMLGLGGCGSWPLSATSARDHLGFLSQVQLADPPAREILWRQVQSGDRGQTAMLRRALLQSFPDHPGYDPVAAETALQALQSGQASSEVAAVARTRLNELRASGECRVQVDALKKRLAKVADIERRTNSKEH